MKDTPKAVEIRLREMISALSPAERLAMACGMFTTAKSLMKVGIASLPKQRQKDELFYRLYRRDFELSQLEKIIKHLSKAGKSQ